MSVLVTQQMGTIPDSQLWSGGGDAGSGGGDDYDDDGCDNGDGYYFSIGWQN